MARVLIAVLLALLLRPVAVAAEPGVPTGRAAALEAVQPAYGHHLLQGLGFAELLGEIRSQPPSSGTRDQRSPARSIPRPPQSTPAPGLRRISGFAAARLDAVVPPACELLPYFATAPPSRG